MAQKTDDTAAPQASRRNFLKLATAAAPAAVAATALAGTAAVAEPQARKSGLQDTEHTRAYFATARF
jgi:hypothetical protein